MTEDDSATGSGSPSNSTSDSDHGASDLDASLTDLSRLVMGTGQPGLEELLKHVAEFAVQAVPGADGVGLTLLEANMVDTMVASADFVRVVDSIQYGIGEGPCITAAVQLRTVRSGSLGEEAIWPRFGPQVANLGVHSALSLPLRYGDSAIGAMNIYAYEKDAFSDRSVELGELYATPAAISVYNAQTLAHAQRLTVELQSALTNRAVIDQALGIIMSQFGWSTNEAFDRLQSDAQTWGLSATAAAQRVVGEAIARAQSRRDH